MYKNIDPFMKILPQLDVHGFTEDIVMTVVNEFIEDSYKLGRIHNDLKNNRLVKRYYLYNFNIGCTIIELN